MKIKEFLYSLEYNRLFEYDIFRGMVAIDISEPVNIVKTIHVLEDVDNDIYVIPCCKNLFYCHNKSYYLPFKLNNKLLYLIEDVYI